MEEIYDGFEGSFHGMKVQLMLKLCFSKHKKLTYADFEQIDFHMWNMSPCEL
jgi:hypothetical protein